MLTKKTFRGAGWSVSSRLISRLIDFVTLLALARWLTPADFGLIAVALILVSVTDVILEMPLTAALTRLREVEQSHLDTAFTLGVIRSGALATIVLCGVWPFSMFYADSRLVPLIIFLMLGPMARSLNSPGMVYFIRAINFRTMFLAETAAKLIACCLALLTLYLGGGYWAVVVSSAAPHVLLALISYILAPYRPVFSLSEMPVFVGFIGWFSSAQLVSAVSWQLDKMLLGHVISKSELGKYSMAGDIAVLPSQSVIGPAMQPVMAAFSMINNDRERLKRAYVTVSRLTMVLSVPAFLGTALCADLVVSVLLGSQWKDSADYLRILSLSMLLLSYYQPLSSMAMAIDQPSSLFRLNLMDLLLRLVAMPLGLYFYSVYGLIIARGLVSVVMFVAYMTTVRCFLGLSISAQLLNLWQVALGCCVMTGVVLLVRDQLAGVISNSLLELAIIAPIGAAIYFATLVAFGVRLKTRPELT